MNQSLEDYCQQFVAGIAGLPGDMVRPRWQPEPPNIPDYGVDWVSTGITETRPIGVYGATIHQPNDEIGTDLMQRHEEFDLLCSFYGPNAGVFASNLHDGLMIWQNKSELRLVGMAFIEITTAQRAPELIKERWWDRVDKKLVFRRIIQRVYRVRNLVWAGGAIHIDEVNDYQQSFHAP